MIKLNEKELENINGGNIAYDLGEACGTMTKNAMHSWEVKTLWNIGKKLVGAGEEDL